ncbi:MAG TPA: class I SAM-dependent methyltransferase, partial [Tepidisphaeraceae bacterium]|nr:class I SAM-dependent methyltransferase [Tepidisphaeraceae bacterium]
MSYRAQPDFYDAENAQLDFLHRDVGFYLSMLPKKPQQLLSLACGNGRTVLPMADVGHKVVGVDYDRAMLEHAVSKRDAVGMSARHAKFVEADLRTMKLDERFDHASIFFNSFLVFTTTSDQSAVLKNVLNVLKPKGSLWIDIFNPDLARIAEPEVDNADPRVFFVPSLGTSVTRLTSIRAGKQAQIREVTFKYQWHDAQGRARKSSTRFSMTYLFPRELELLLHHAGFSRVEMWGDYKKSSTLQSDSSRIIAR